MVHALEIVIDLRAERTAIEWMRRVARQPLGGPIPDLYDPAARVRAVMPAGTANDLNRTG